MVYEERKEKVEQLIRINDIFLIKLVNSTLIHSFNEIDSLHNDFVSNGYEGIMLRDRNGIYEPNKRSKYLQKYKKFMEEEFQIIDFKEGTGDEKRMCHMEMCQ
jgi:ATP dependent DNA ligase domain.